MARGTIPIPRFETVIPVVADVPRAAAPIETAGADARALASSFTGLADSFSKLADGAAKREGEQQGINDGAAPDFAPRRDGTIRGEARDAAGADRYMRELDTRLRQGLDRIAQEGRDLSETELRNRMDEFAKGMRENIAFQEGRVIFDQAYTRLAYGHAREANERRITRENEDSRTTLEFSLQERARTIQRMAYGAGADPKAHEAMAAELSAYEREIMASTTIPAGAKRRLIANAQREAQEAVVYGLFDREADPAKRQEILTRFRDEYQRGEGIARNLTADQFRRLESHMTQGINRARTVDQAALNQLERDMNDLVDQSRQATPATAAAWSALEARAASLAGGQRIIALGQAKLQLAQELAGMPVEQADARMRELERQWRTNGGTNVRPGVDMANLAEPAQRMLRGIQSTPGLPRLDIVSGFRDPARNALAGGAQYSQHQDGNAVDISTRGWTDEQRSAFLAAAIANGARGIGIYPGGSIHIDTRATPTMWGPNGHRSSEIETFPAWAQPHLRQLQASGGRDAPSAQELATRAPTGTGGGFSSDQAELIQFGRKQVDEARTMLGRDPLGYADRYLRVPVAPLDWGGDAVAVATQIGQRVSTAEAIGQQLRRAPTYLRPDEVERMREIVDKGGVQGTAVVQAIVQGAGTRAPAILKEIGGSAPALAQAGVLVASGAPRAAADDLLEAQRLKAVQGFQLPRPPRDAMRIAGEEIGGALDQYPEERARILAAAADIYGTRAHRNSFDGRDSASQEAYRKAIQDAMAATRRDGRQFGGVATVQPGWWSTYRVAVPNDVDARRFGQVIREIRDEDLATLPVPPQTADGRPFAARDIHQAVPVRYGEGYRFALGDPRSDDPKWIRGADGNPFVLPWAAVAPTLRSRIPSAFLGGG